jgi:hypothetical protein
VSRGQTHGLLISPCALFIFKVSMTTWSRMSWLALSAQ